MIEVEVRGKIEDFDKVLNNFKSKARFIEEKDRLSLIYFRHEVVKDVSDVRDEMVDLRLRITNKKSELILKYGTWGGSDSRKEISIPISINKFLEAVELLHLIGWNKGVVMETNTYVFNYKDVEFSLVKSKHLNYFEAERLVAETKNNRKEEEKINEVCVEMKLKPFTDKEFIDEINKVNNSGDKFDFERDSFDKVKTLVLRYV